MGIYKKQFKVFQKTDPLAYIRESFAAPQRWTPLTSMRMTYRKIRDQYQAGNYAGTAKAVARGVLELPFYTEKCSIR